MRWDLRLGMFSRPRAYAHACIARVCLPLRPVLFPRAAPWGRGESGGEARPSIPNPKVPAPWTRTAGGIPDPPSRTCGRLPGGADARCVPRVCYQRPQARQGPCAPLPCCTRLSSPPVTWGGYFCPATSYVALGSPAGPGSQRPVSCEQVRALSSAEYRPWGDSDETGMDCPGGPS